MVIKIHIYLFLVIAYMYAIKKLEIFMWAYFFIILHEIAHVIMAMLFNVKIYEIELLPIGVNAKYVGKISAIKEFAISLAGPIASYLFYKFLKIGYLKEINLFISITNLIPLKPYDGGRIIYSLLSLSFGEEIAKKMSIKIQKMSLNLLTILAIILLVNYK